MIKLYICTIRLERREIEADITLTSYMFVMILTKLQHPKMRTTKIRIAAIF